MRWLTNTFAGAMSLTGLYLVLRYAAGATSLLKAASSGTVDFFRTLQGR